MPTLQRLTITNLLRPHFRRLSLGMLAVIGAAVANLLEPWPLKVVVDSVLKSQPLKHGWLNERLLDICGNDKLSIVKFAAVAYVVIACVDAICSYLQKYITTSVGQWIMHDLRRAVYAHIQKLSLAFHDQTQTGDLLTRATGDIDTVQSFIASGVLDIFINGITIIGMIGVMFYLNWRFTLIALSVMPILGVVVYSFTRRIKKASREVRKKEGEIVSIMQEVLTSIRVVKAFAQEDQEQHRMKRKVLRRLKSHCVRAVSKPGYTRSWK